MAAQQARETPKKGNYNWLVHYKYSKPEDPHRDMRNVLLVVSTLIATVTFQANVNHAGGVWQDEKTDHRAGSAIYASHKKPFYVFLVFNMLSLSSSISFILSLTFMFPFSMEIWITTVSMIVTYGSAVFAITPHQEGNSNFRYLLITVVFPLLARFGVEICRYVKRRCFPEVKIGGINLWRLMRCNCERDNRG